MSALILLGAMAIWFAIGWILWRALVQERIQNKALRYTIAAAFLGIWLVAPWLDEIFGARAFNRLCGELPPITFYGPVAVGPGVLFDESGEPRFSAKDDLSDSLTPYGTEFDRLFVSREERKQVRTWPIPIYDNPVTWYDARSGQPVLMKPYRASPGGWIRRIVRWSNHAPLVCPVKGKFPRTTEWVRFHR